MIVLILFFGTKWLKKERKGKENYLENQVPLASANRKRFSPAGRVIMEEKISLLLTPCLARQSHI
jgi:hypothetical protein